MKLRHLFTGAILTAGLMAATALTSLAAGAGNASIKGRFETTDSSVISGWAYDSSSSDESLTVRISITDQESGEEVFSHKITANEYRQDLYDSGKGNGCHGFTYSMDWSRLPEGVYLIEGMAEGRSFFNPQTYTNGQPKADESDGESSSPSGLIPLGVFKTTGYCPCRSCSGGWGRHTSTGAVATAGRTIAVDPNVIPYGTQVMINGVVYTAEDRGGAVKGNHIDIFFNTHTESYQHGLQHAEVFLVA